MITGRPSPHCTQIAKRTALVEQDEEKVITGKDHPAMDKLPKNGKEKKSLKLCILQD